jgi:beta-glucosidase
MDKRIQIYIKPFVLFLLTFVLISCTKYQNSSSTDQKVESLIAQMTLEEKIGQMTQICFSMITEGRGKKLVLDKQAARDAILNHHVGSFLSGTGSEAEWISFLTEVQRIAVEETRLGIPLIIGIDHIHGANYVNEGVIFPHNITLSCSFDKDLIAETASLTAKQTGRLGLHWNFAPVLGIAKNPYWPRFYETYGEDPYLCSLLGSTFVDAYQQNITNNFSLAACAKHFIGYSDPVSGWDRTPAYIPMQTLYEDFLPPFEASLNAGAKTVMLNSGEVNGEPVHISETLVQGMLRNHLGFDGVILTDIKDILKVVEMHSAAANEEEATKLSIDAGIDVSMACDAFRFPGIVKVLVQKGKITEKRIDQSVRRILKLKFDLGLFEHPYPITDEIARPDDAELYQSAVKAAEESIVLLKNDDALPLTPNARILLTGFAADSKKHMNGAWTFEWLGAEEERQPESMPTLKTAMQKKFTQINYLETPDISSTSGVNELESALKRCDVVVLTIGEKSYSEFKGNINDLNLDENQQRLCRTAINSNKPVVFILVEGRPRLITDFENDASAILFTGYPGMGGPEAIANILSGQINPSGKLSFTYPRNVAHHSTYYHKPSESYEFLYPFGHGLSYTQFEYSRLFISDTLIHDVSQPLSISFDVKNTGSKEGKETIMIFMRDCVGTITRPVKKLVYFEKINLKPNETETLQVQFKPKNVFSYSNASGDSRTENGEFIFMVGTQEESVWLKQK